MRWWITTHRGPGLAPRRAATARRAIRLAADSGGPDPLNPTLGSGMKGGVLASGPGSLASEGLTELQLEDSGKGRLRTVWLYSPPPGSTENPTPLLILHDGQVWAKYVNLKATLDAAVHTGVVPPLHVAMVDSFDGATRSRELSGPVGSVDFVARDLLPLLRRTLPVRSDAAGTIVSGASYGGLASLWQVARYPDLVGVALAQSPPLWRYDLAEPLAKVADRVPLGAGISLRSVTGGHDWTWWNPWLIHGLTDLPLGRDQIDCD